MYTLGLDIGSSSIKAAILDVETGRVVAQAQFPDTEMPMQSHKPGWAEQDPEMWWRYTQDCIKEMIRQHPDAANRLQAIGISYQMHGLVVMDASGNVLRPSIIWCDSRAVSIGHEAFQRLGESHSLTHLLNSPGNFTAAKLAWVKQHEPQIYEQITHFCLPGDYIGYKLSGDIRTTLSGLSEGIMWDFQSGKPAFFLLEDLGIPADWLPDFSPAFAAHGEVTSSVAKALGIPAGIPITYKAGDQPNNALSLNVLAPGEIAATAGTSGVIYGVSDTITYDPQSRVNTFAHVNHTTQQNRLGILLCVNGTGILNNWLQKNVTQKGYEAMNHDAAQIPIGSDGLVIHPFGNGAERVLENAEPGAHINHLAFNTHTQAHMIRAAHEGIAFALHYGLEIMKPLGINPQVMRAGLSNMFQSPVFRQTLANITETPIELYNTDGAQGAARGAAIGSQKYSDLSEAFHGLKCLQTIEPITSNITSTQEAYIHWHDSLLDILSTRM